MGKHLSQETVELLKFIGQSKEPLTLGKITKYHPKAFHTISNLNQRGYVKVAGKDESNRNLYVLTEKSRILLKEKGEPSFQQPSPSPLPKQNFVDPEKVVEGIFKKIQEIMALNKALKAEIKDLREENTQLRVLAGKEQKKPLSVPNFLLSCHGD